MCYLKLICWRSILVWVWPLPHCPAFYYLTILYIDFNLDFYTEVMDLNYLHQYLDQSSPQLVKLNKAICGLIQDFSLVSFIPLNIQVIYKYIIWSVNHT